MYARMIAGNIKVDKLDEAIQMYRDDVVPDATKFGGFEGIYLFTDAETGRFISLALYTTKEDMLAQEKSGWLQETMSAFGPLLAGAPVTERLEVSAAA